MPEREIEELLERYKAAVYAKDVDAFVALFDEHVRVFDMWGRWSYDSAEQWRQPVGEWFGSLGSDRVVVEFDDLQTVVGDDVAGADAFVTFRAQSPDGEELRSMNNRLTWVLRKNGEGTWKVVHEHTSAPIDFETAEVMLERPNGA